jgi:L-threonylcarbamoyladenylate synthase
MDENARAPKSKGRAMTDEELRHALGFLSDGGVVAAATETFFGLLADVSRSTAIDRVFALKGRDASKGVAMLLPNRGAWSSLVTEVLPMAGFLADAFWPGPLTIALLARSGIDERLQLDGTIAVRWPGPSDASRLTAAFGAPLTATSANVAGQAPAITAADVKRAFSRSIARGELMVLPGRAPGGEPSTLVRVDGGRMIVLRQGQIRESDLAGVVERAALG